MIFNKENFNEKQKGHDRKVFGGENLNIQQKTHFQSIALNLGDRPTTHHLTATPYIVSKSFLDNSPDQIGRSRW